MQHAAWLALALHPLVYEEQHSDVTGAHAILWLYTHDPSHSLQPVQRQLSVGSTAVPPCGALESRHAAHQVALLLLILLFIPLFQRGLDCGQTCTHEWNESTLSRDACL